MKKPIFLLSTMLLLFTSCGFQSRKDFEKELEENHASEEENFDMPNITYVSEGESIDYNKDKNVDFMEIYGAGKIGENLKPEEAAGNILDLDLDGYQYAISLLPAGQTEGAYSSFLSFIKNDELEEVEFGPIAGIENLSSIVTYDTIRAEAGPMLLVSQITVLPTETYSEYYLYNKYMSLVDSLTFTNTTENVKPSVKRLGNLISSNEGGSGGDIKLAIDSRMQMEKEHLSSLLGVYNIKEAELIATLNGEDIAIGYLPDLNESETEKRLLLMKSNNSPSSNGMNINIE